MHSKLKWKYISPTTISAKSISGKSFEIYSEFSEDFKDNFNIELQSPQFDFMLRYDGEGVDFLQSKATTELEKKAFEMSGNFDCWHDSLKNAIAIANEIEYYIRDSKKHSDLEIYE